ncbi:ABC transporter transmembrane domain-containing protein [Streptomyces sp. CS147]|uniref:ABC transporter transmembrane domain-containing protein n=1 Tax=Streptomyces sp. CS147 TaxID=2162715 RepID=UPI000D50F131|nr:ABC transporter transmembrane domain-containing protein [Streptomyces sp. CS147]PVC95128.1 hypothetical protein DBP21_28725 [Streptomyces sp. CS147]
MIRDLSAVLGSAHRAVLFRYLAALGGYAVAQGLAVSLLVPVLGDLLGGDTGGAARWTGWLAVAVLITLGAHYVQAMLGFRVALVILTTLHHRLGDHVAALPLGWFDGTTVGRLTRMGTKSVLSIAGSCAHLLQPLVTGVLTPATVVVVMVFLDWRLGLAALVCSPLILLAARVSVRLLKRLPDGWETRVGEAGTSLSGGERQRVSIARALLKDAPIVLLDEATAALDPENEAYVQRSMEALRERSTLLVIAHRLSTVTAADQIVVLDEGLVTEVGTHQELMVLDGRYARFWNERHRALGWRIAVDTS